MANVISALGKEVNFEKLRIQHAALQQQNTVAAPQKTMDFGGFTADMLGMSLPPVNKVPRDGLVDIKPKLSKPTSE